MCIRDRFTGEHHDGGLFALLPKAVFRSEQFMGAALLYWMNRLPPAEFAEKLGSMSSVSYTHLAIVLGTEGDGLPRPRSVSLRRAAWGS